MSLWLISYVISAFRKVIIPLKDNKRIITLNVLFTCASLGNPCYLSVAQKNLKAVLYSDFIPSTNNIVIYTTYKTICLYDLKCSLCNKAKRIHSYQSTKTSPMFKPFGDYFQELHKIKVFSYHSKYIFYNCVGYRFNILTVMS